MEELFVQVARDRRPAGRGDGGARRLLRRGAKRWRSCSVWRCQPSAGHGVRKAIWRRFGTWLLLGLEFELAADIIGSAVSPTWQDIGQLGAIAVIRTFLNYFLEHDLEKAERAGEPA